MKPEHFCSGNYAAGEGKPERSTGFNEAGAFLLRKLRFALHPLHLSACFNEAGAFLLRKRAAIDLFDAMKAAASMKPEHFCSGNKPQAPLRLAPSSCFNEAGAFLLRKHAIDQPGLDPVPTLQ